MTSRTRGRRDDRLRQEVGSERDGAWGQESGCRRVTGADPRRKCEKGAGDPGNGVWAEGVAEAPGQGQRALRGAVSEGCAPRPVGASFPSRNLLSLSFLVFKMGMLADLPTWSRSIEEVHRLTCLPGAGRGPGVGRLGSDAALGEQ